MPTYTHIFTLLSTTRPGIRREVINHFLNEQPGLGTGINASTNIYIVEQYGNYTVQLKRPATLNKGMDFTVEVSGFKFKYNTQRAHSNPSHNDIIYILQTYKYNNPNYYHYVEKIIKDFYNCVNINLNRLGPLPPFTDYLGQQRPIETILYCIKWLFIEQDITYWNWSGRAMFFNTLRTNGLV